MNNVYLVGMMGSGKSSAGRKLAVLLSRSYVDLDSEVETHAGRPVSAIFERDGEARFRSLEREVLCLVSQQSNQVVATGGGIVLDPANCDVMKRTGEVIYLKANVETLWGRVQHSRHRPLLAAPDPKGALVNRLAERAPLYEAVATKTVVTDAKLTEAVAREISAALVQKR